MTGEREVCYSLLRLVLNIENLLSPAAMSVFAGRTRLEGGPPKIKTSGPGRMEVIR